MCPPIQSVVGSPPGESVSVKKVRHGDLGVPVFQALRFDLGGS